MILLRLYRAEHALAAGRLEEAATIIEAANVREHRRAQTLLTELTAAYLARAKKHLDLGDAQRALIDAGRAVRLAGDQPAATTVRDAAERLLADQRRKDRRDARRIAAARQRIAAGDVSTGRAMLAGHVKESSSIGLLMQDAEADRRRGAEALAAAAAAVARGDLATAQQQLAIARQINPKHPELSPIVRTFGDAFRTQLVAALRDGRLDIAASLAAQIDVGCATIELQADLQSLADLSAAARSAAGGDFAEAAVRVQRAAHAIGDLPWLRETRDQLEQAAAATAAIRAGPLSYLIVARAAAPTTHRAAHEVSASAIATARAAFNPSARTSPFAPLPTADRGSTELAEVRPPTRTVRPPTLPASFLLQADGGDAVCVICSPTIRVGPVSSSRPPDLALVVDSLTPAATIERIDEDYFLKSSPGVAVNDRPAADRLLSSGDKLALSTRCRLTFAIPNAASTTAVLELTGARTSRADIRRAVLLDRELILGAGATAHVRVDHLATPVVLTLRDGGLFAGDIAIPFGESVTVGGAAIVVKAM